MKKRFIIFHAVPAALFVGIFSSLVFVPSAVKAQGRVSRIVKVTPAGNSASAEKAALNAKFATAVTENSRSVTALNWTFGGRVQTGWEIYEPLIADSIGTSSDAVIL